MQQKNHNNLICKSVHYNLFSLKPKYYDYQISHLFRKKRVSFLLYYFPNETLLYTI